MGLGSYGVVTAVGAKSMPLFLASFWVLFTAAGAGNGSTYRMIPAIFAAKSPDLATAKRESAATLGIAGAVGALGGFYLPRAISDSIKATGGISTAFTWFAVHVRRLPRRHLVVLPAPPRPGRAHPQPRPRRRLPDRPRRLHPVATQGQSRSEAHHETHDSLGAGAGRGGGRCRDGRGVPRVAK